MSARTSRRRTAAKRSNRRAVALASGAAAAALPVMSFFGTAPGLASEPPAYDCGEGGVFEVAGTDDPNHLHTRGLETRYTEQGYTIHHVEYPATFWPLGAQSYDANIETGKAALTEDVATYQANCPGKPVVIVGYSQGARIAGDVLADIAAGEAEGVTEEGVSGELYSDPRRRGTNEGAGAEVNLINAYPGALLDGTRAEDAFGDIPVYSFCIDGDPACDLPDLRRDPIGALDALLGFSVKHLAYDDMMTAGPDATIAGAGVTVIVEADGASVIFIAADPALTILLAQIGLPNLLKPVIIDFPYLDVAFVQPISRAILGLLPSLPELGHGAYISDLYTFRDALSGDPAAWAAIFGSAVSLVEHPANFVRDWVAVIDAVLDHRDPDLGFITAPTVRAVATAAFGVVTKLGAIVADHASDAVFTQAAANEYSEPIGLEPMVLEAPAEEPVAIPEPSAGRHRAPEPDTSSAPVDVGAIAPDIDIPDTSPADPKPEAGVPSSVAEEPVVTESTPVGTVDDLEVAS